MKHDGCRSTEKYRPAGQNLFSSSSTGGYADVSKLVVSATNGWYSEIKNALPSDIDRCCGKNIGHFTQIIQDETVAIGCAVSQYGNKWKVTLMACNYSSPNWSGSKIYKTGPTASACPNGTHPAYKNLCKQ